MPFNTLNDFLPVSLYAINPTLLAAHPSLPAANVKELIALMKAKPNTLKMSTAGAGTAGHFAGVLFNKMAGVEAVVVHYPGGGPAITAVLDNVAQWTFAPIAGRLPHVRTGKLKALATGASKRLTVLPEVPTVAESGLPGYESVGWAGIWVPKGTPQPIVDKMHATLVKVIATPELKRDGDRRRARRPRAARPPNSPRGCARNTTASARSRKWPASCRNDELSSTP